MMNRTFLRLFVVCFSLMLSTFELSAQERSSSDSLWSVGNEQYAAAQYPQALDLFKKIEASGVESAGLYYNIGNTYYKMRSIAHAILYYEKALLLEPNNKDIQYNLRIAQEQCIDKIEPVPQFFLVTWIAHLQNSLSSNAWAGLCLMFLVITAVFLLVFFFARRVGFRKLGFILAVIVFVLSLSCGILSWRGRSQAVNSRDAIVFNAVSSLKSSPDARGKDLLVVHEGTKVLVLEEMGEWARVELADGRQGWIVASEINFVHL